MKKIAILMCIVFACMMQVKAQEPQFVSKEQENRKVIIEELTGRMCGWCPLGQYTVNQILEQYPEKVFTVNIHRQSSLSPTSYPNLNTSEGGAIYDAFTNGGIPAAIINRSTTQAVGLSTQSNTWATMASQQLQQTAECNVAGVALINKDDRKATITVEVYYTANSASSENYLTVIMLQDNIQGYQAGSGDNPDQEIYVDGNKTYNHMHILRDIITPTWGDAIAPTTAGTLITKTYEYEIPEVIGETNGVAVDLENVQFLAIVTEKQQNGKTSPVLNVNKLNSLKAANTEYYPYFQKVELSSALSCSNDKTLNITINNGGTEDITSLKYQIIVRGVVNEFTWEGNLPSYSSLETEIECELPVGEHYTILKIVEVNGIAYQYEEAIMLTVDAWTDIYFPNEEEEVKIDIIQDKFGNQTTWELLDAENNVIASGGPYSVLATNGVKMNRTKVNISNNKWYRFVIYDEAANGINNGSGEGYYKITDSAGNIVLQGDGKFTDKKEHAIATKEGALAIDETVVNSYKIFPNPVNDVLTISGEDMRQITIFNAVGQLVKTIECNENTVVVDVDDLQNGMYVVNVISNNGTMTTSKISVLK